MQNEVSKRGLQVVTISGTAGWPTPDARQATLDSARTAMKFLADFGANHLVASAAQPRRERTRPPRSRNFASAAIRSARLPAKWGSRPACTTSYGRDGPQTQEEVDRFMAMTDPNLGLSNT